MLIVSAIHIQPLGHKMSYLMRYTLGIDLQVAVVHAYSDVEITAEFHDGFRASYHGAKHMYHNISREDLLGNRARLASVRDQCSSKLVAGVRGFLLNPEYLHIVQAWTDPNFRGSGLIGTAVDLLRLSFFMCPDIDEESVSKAILQVRVIDGKVDRSAERAYRKVDFTKTAVKKTVIEGTREDAHLLETHDGDGCYSSQFMEADRSSLCRAMSRLTMKNLRFAA